MDSASSGSFNRRYSSAFELASVTPSSEIGFSLGSITLLQSPGGFRSLDSPHQAQQRIVEIVYHTLLEGDDGIVCDVNVFRAHLGAAFRDVAKADAQFVLQQSCARHAVEWMHLQRRHSHKETRAPELLLLMVIAQHMADVLA